MNVNDHKHNRILYLYGRKELLEQQLREQARIAGEEIAAAQQEIDRLREHLGYDPGRGQEPPKPAPLFDADELTALRDAAIQVADEFGLTVGPREDPLAFQTAQIKGDRLIRKLQDLTKED